MNSTNNSGALKYASILLRILRHSFLLKIEPKVIIRTIRSSKKDLFLALIEHWETTAFPDFYEKNKNGVPASEILKSFANVVADVFEQRKYVFLAEVEFWALANRDVDVQGRTKHYTKKFYHFSRKY